METFWVVLVVIGVGLFIWLNLWMQKSEKMAGAVDPPPQAIGATPVRPQTAADQQAQIVCTYCQTAGGVTYRHVKRRRRLSVTRVITATATMGASLPLAGTSKKNHVTEMNCRNCGMTWDVI